MSKIYTPLTSLAAANISATSTPLHTTQPVTPLLGTIPLGSYNSRIDSVSDVVYNGEAVAVDFVHELTASNGSTIWARFRYYPRELDALVHFLATYGLSGTLNVATIGLEELVTIAPKPNSGYLHIAARQLRSPISSSPSPSVPPCSSTPPTSGLPTSVSTKRRGGLLGSKRSSTPPSPPTPTQAKLLTANDDDEFDDFLEDDEE